MYSYLDDAILEGLILEAAIATPYNVEENIKRGKMAMQHVISSHKYEPRAMYRKDLGWIGFEWGRPGDAPPNFKNIEEALKWWNGLKNKLAIYRGGYGISHIIAKRDWEGQWIKEFIGQKGIDVAYRLIQVIAKGKPGEDKGRKIITWKGVKAVLRRPPAKYRDVKKDEEWLLSGYYIAKEGYQFILESADGAAVESYPPLNASAISLFQHTAPTYSPTFGTHWQTGAANSSKIINSIDESVNTGWLYDL